MKNAKLNGYDFDRQRAIGNYIVDFYCKDAQLAIEIDGITHEEEKAKWKDERRQKELEEAGIHFLRFDVLFVVNKDALLVVNKVEAVVREIASWLEEYEKENGVSEFVKRRREKDKGETHPCPSKEGMLSHSPCFSKMLFFIEESLIRESSEGSAVVSHPLLGGARLKND